MSDLMAKRIVMAVAPHFGGIFSFYEMLRSAALQRGGDTAFLELGSECDRWNEYIAGDREDRLEALVIEDDWAATARQIVGKIESFDGDVLIITPRTPLEVLCALPHLSGRVCVIARPSEITFYNYRFIVNHSEAIDRVVAICPRQVDDLSKCFGFVGDGIDVIPNGVDTSRFAVSRTAGDKTLRLLFMDRLVESQKRIMLLPRVLRRLDRSQIRWRLTVAGDGPDRRKLEEALGPWRGSGHACFTGWVARSEVPSLFAAHDVYLKLSRNEGSPSSVIEAMAAGCVPVAVNIPGVMDFVINRGSGVVVSRADPSAIASAILRLACEPSYLAALKSGAQARARAEFSIDVFGDRWARAFEPPKTRRRRLGEPWDSFRAPSERKRSPLREAAKRLVPLKWRIALREQVARRIRA